MKKMMSTLLTLAMCFCLFGAVPAQAAGGDFVVTDGVLLKYYGNGGDVVIPDGVTSIGERVFYSNQNITSVTIPEGVTYIGPNAFFRCKNMTSVKLPSTLETIQFSAFEDCDGLTEPLPPQWGHQHRA